MAKKAKKGPGLWAEFKEFINRGNAFMLAVGVVIGGAFSAIVNAVVNILLSLSTAALPGGLAGFVTRLDTPTAISALKTVQSTIAEAKMQLTIDEYLSLCNTYGAATINGIYNKFGGKYIFATAPVLNWGALITAIISFIIIAVVLFIIVKVVNAAARKKDELKAKAQEAYYEKHPEERPVPPEEGKPEPTEIDYLKRIADALEKKKQAIESLLIETLLRAKSLLFSLMLSYSIVKYEQT